MIDIETLDCIPQTQIVSIAGVKFDPKNSKEPFDTFYNRLDIDEQALRGRTIGEETLEWWQKQDKEVILEAFSEENRILIPTMLDSLKKWYVGCTRIWSHGTTFDITILENVCREYNKPIPWPYGHIMDSKTVFRLLKKDPRRAMNFTAHHPLEDCIYQAKAVQIAYKNLGIF